MTEESSRAISVSAVASRQNNFDQLRLILAIMVILDHSYRVTEHFDPLFTLSLARFQLGSVAVYGFFILSGYLIANSWNHSSGALDFVRKRCLRIYPALICALLLSLFVFAPLGGSDLHKVFQTEDPYHFLAAPLLLGNFQYTIAGFCPKNYYCFQLNDPLWTIRYEVFCYLLVLFVGSIKFLQKKWTMPIAMLCCMIVAFKWSDSTTVPYFGMLNSFPILVAFFLSGVCLLQFESKIANIVQRSTLGATLILGVLLIIVMEVIPGAFDCFSLPILGTYVIWLFVTEPKLHFYDAQRFGDYSYGLYIFAFPIQQLLAHFYPKIAPMTLFLESLALTFICAFLSWHCIEKPSLRLKKNTSVTEVH